MENELLGGMPASRFMRRHWQKEPLLVRNAVPGFAGILDLGDMIELACRDDCESRLVSRRGHRWDVERGPLRRTRLRQLPPRGWTLLVQGVDRFLPAARDLLSRFDFIPHARLDDLMVSYAPPGGGVGPHFDSYDVFLLQGPGQRRWQVGRQKDLALVEGAPLKILRRFAPQGESVLGPGDMLYLPPDFAHDGVALNACYTYSIGFRAPSHQELLSQFLVFLEERVTAAGRYGDPDLRPQARPGHIPDTMIARVERLVGSICWRRTDVAEFLGTYLTEPKVQVRFSPPRRPLPAGSFMRQARARGLSLSLGTQMLYCGSSLFINGESLSARGRDSDALRTLADRRQLPGTRVPSPPGMAADTLYQWYRAGYIFLGEPATET